MAPGRAASAPAAAARSPIELLRHLDVVIVAIALPVGLILGAPALGFLLGIGAWLVQRGLAYADRRWIARAREPGSRLGLDIADSFARIWLLAGAIVVAGAVGGRSDGLAAALTIFAAYSVAFATRLASGRGGFER
ncbi:MAG TPA: hypothetical protein VNV42_15020 [Solirubrobacteraceae bacterium]|jgi:hypothetical protein|nr:hypothetical protein [Solirubrobacteraceae bacterium]